MHVAFAEPNPYGVADHRLTGEGFDVEVSMRVVPNADGSEVGLTVSRAPGPLLLRGRAACRGWPWGRWSPSAAAPCGVLARGLRTSVLARVWFAATALRLAGHAVLVLGGEPSGSADPLGVALAALAGGSCAAYTGLAEQRQERHQHDGDTLRTTGNAGTTERRRPANRPSGGPFRASVRQQGPRGPGSRKPLGGGRRHAGDPGATFASGR